MFNPGHIATTENFSKKCIFSTFLSIIFWWIYKVASRQVFNLEKRSSLLKKCLIIWMAYAYVQQLTATEATAQSCNESAVNSTLIKPAPDSFWWWCKANCPYWNWYDLSKTFGKQLTQTIPIRNLTSIEVRIIYFQRLLIVSNNLRWEFLVYCNLIG